MEDGGKDEAFLTGSGSRPKIANWSTKDFILSPIFKDSTRRRADGSRLATTSSPRRRRNSEYLMKKFTKTKVLEIWWGYKGGFVVFDSHMIRCYFVMNLRAQLVLTAISPYTFTDSMIFSSFLMQCKHIQTVFFTTSSAYRK